MLTHGCWIVLVKLPKSKQDNKTSSLLFKAGFEFDAFYLTIVQIVFAVDFDATLVYY